MEPSDRNGDIWKSWLLFRRNLSSENIARAEEHYRTIRDKVLADASVEAGETLLDTGTGTGLIAFGALPLVGDNGTVIFSDISEDCLEHCRSFAEEIGVAGRAKFLRLGIEDL